MRIIAGSAKGRPLKTLEGMNTRPTLDKVREAIFGKLQFMIPGSRVLDMFAGSGAMGIEALSRGADSCVFIEKNRQAMKIVMENAENCKLKDKSVFMLQDYKKACEALKGGEKFDFIFIDPPYAEGMYESSFELATELLFEDGMIVAEHDRAISKPIGFELIDEKHYSSVSVSYFKRAE